MVDNLFVLYTSALIDNQFEERKIDYEKSYSILSEFINHSNIFIVECYSHEENFFTNFVIVDLPDPATPSKNKATCQLSNSPKLKKSLPIKTYNQRLTSLEKSW